MRQLKTNETHEYKQYEHWVLGEGDTIDQVVARAKEFYEAYLSVAQEINPKDVQIFFQVSSSYDASKKTS